jgi:gas vesicle protein
MLGNARTAVKFLVYGLVIGLFFAPRSGKETRQEVMHWISEAIQDTVGSVTGNAGKASPGEDTTQPTNG